MNVVSSQRFTDVETYSGSKYIYGRQWMKVQLHSGKWKVFSHLDIINTIKNHFFFTLMVRTCLYLIRLYLLDKSHTVCRQLSEITH